MALVVYEPPATTPLTTPHRVFTLPYSGRVNISQAWGQNGARTGSAVWDAGVVLAFYLDAQHARWQHRSVMELGAGLGLASIVASRCGFEQVLATDGDSAVVPMALRNAAAELQLQQSLRAQPVRGMPELDERVRLSAADVDVAHLRWNDTDALDRLIPAGARLPDLIMASDVLYVGASEAWDDFLSLVAGLCSRRRDATKMTAIISRAPPSHAAAGDAAEDARRGTCTDSVAPVEAPARSIPSVLQPMTRHDGTVSVEGDPVVLLSHTMRYAREEQQFFRAARRQGFAAVQLPANALHEQHRINGRSQLFELHWKGEK